MGNLMPSQFYSSVAAAAAPPQASGSQGPTPQERKQQLLTSIKPLLLAQQLTGAQAVQALVQKINDFGAQDVDAPTRQEIVTKIRDGAGNPYFRAWSENITAMDITRDWLKAAFTAKADNPLVENIMPLLHVSDTSYKW